MVIAAFPLAKIGLLLMKQLSKPLANIIKNRAKKHPVVRKYVIIPTGKVYHFIEVQALSKEMPSEGELTEDEIVELGSNAIGEIILFGLLTMILLAEYNKHGEQKAVQKKIKEDEIHNLVNTVLDTIEEVNVLKKTLAKLEKDLSVTVDAMQAEEEKHTLVIEDHDFLDVMLTPKTKFWPSKKKPPVDQSSP